MFLISIINPIHRQEEVEVDFLRGNPSQLNAMVY